jgi:hypothetical protein
VTVGLAEGAIGIERIKIRSVKVAIEGIGLEHDIESASVGMKDGRDIHQAQYPPRTDETASTRNYMDVFRINHQSHRISRH